MEKNVLTQDLENLYPTGQTQMLLSSLDNTPRNEIYLAFCEAFTDYVIPMKFNEKSTYLRWENSGIDFKKSYGYFEKERLVAFILQASVGSSLHNFATGVIPSHRGRRLIQSIYSTIVNDHHDYNDLSLEVIRENEKALTLYRHLGFRVERELHCFEGKLNVSSEFSSSSTYGVKGIFFDDLEMDLVSLMKPAAESARVTLRKHPCAHELHELRQEGELIAFATYTPASASLREIGAIDPIDTNLDKLFRKMKLSGENLRVMNLEGKASSLISYFTSRGLRPFVSQFEMKRKI